MKAINLQILVLDGCGLHVASRRTSLAMEEWAKGSFRSMVAFLHSLGGKYEKLHLLERALPKFFALGLNKKQLGDLVGERHQNKLVLWDATSSIHRETFPRLLHHFDEVLICVFVVVCFPKQKVDTCLPVLLFCSDI